MTQGCYGRYRLPSTDLKELRMAWQGILTRSGFAVQPARRSENSFKVEAIHGNRVLALFAQLLPFADLFGSFSLSRAIVSATKSLDDDDDSIYLTVRIVPRGEVTGLDESFLSGQEIAQYIGDNRKAAELFDHIMAEFEAPELIDETIREVQTKVSLTGSRETQATGTRTGTQGKDRPGR